MGRLTQFLDYMNRPSDEFSLDFVKSCYTHIEITPKLKELRKKLKWHKKEETQGELFTY